jgi:hypothetical protein
VMEIDGFVLAVSISHESSSRHPSVTPFSPATAPPPANATSPKRPLILNKDNPAEAALSKKLSALTNDLQRKQDQINSLTDRKTTGGMRQQYDKLVSELLKQQDMLKGKHAELHKKLEESNVRFSHRSVCFNVDTFKACHSPCRLMLLRGPRAVSKQVYMVC